MDAETIKTLITVLISAGGAAFVKEVFTGVMKLRSGKPAREGTRRIDIIAQRDRALAEKKSLEVRLDTEEKRADDEARKRRLLEEYATDLRRFCIEHGTARDSMPQWPTY